MSTTTALRPEARAAAPGRFSRASVVSVLRSNGLLVFFLLLIVAFAVMKPQFVSEANLRNILSSASILGILAIGQTVVMLTGGFDLAVARTAVIAGMVAALVAPAGPVAVLAGLAAAALVGLVNGTLIARAKVNPFVVTLGMFTMLGSFALLVNNGGSLNDVPSWMVSLTSGGVFGLSGVTVWFLAAAVVAHLVLTYTRFGRQIFAIGGNFEAARLAGIKADRTLVSAYVACATLAGLAGVLLTSRLQTASPVALPGMELDAIAAVIIGGTRMSGGFGSVPRTIVGVLVLTSLTSGLVILGVAAYWQGVLKGAVIIAAVAVDVLFAKRP